MSPQQVSTEVENNFTKGLITEFTGLNFPENAATDTDNCTFTLVGDVLRREGIDFEINHLFNTVNRANKAISTYKWNNAGGDGSTQVIVVQVGGTLYFYRSSSATSSSPISANNLGSTIDISTFFVTVGGSFDPSVECQYADGNGYLFVYHPGCDPFYVSYNAGVLTGNKINVQIRDFAGIPETIGVSTRPVTLTNDHDYNLQNQGWTLGAAWSAVSTDAKFPATGSQTWGVGTVAGITVGQYVTIRGNFIDTNGNFNVNLQETASGIITGYSAGFLTINVLSMNTNATIAFNRWSFSLISTGFLDTWFAALGNYPSNSDVWWYFKNAAGVFSPATTQANVTLGISNAPQGHFILSAFNQDRTSVSGLSGLTSITTNTRPSNGAWFQGRVWYTGLNASQQPPPFGDAPFFTWTESIYFSKIVQTPADFGQCYQENDPTSENLFDLLPTDGGVINIQGSGTIYKLFPLLNALLVFAANGVWYITGSTGVGFTASDYTIVKLSSVQSISSTSFVDIQGLPMFWNEEGIYKVAPAKQGTGLLSSPLHVNPLEVAPVTIGTILSFYNSIPLSSKKYARGAYNPIDYIVQWIYKDTEASSVTDRYTYNKILNYNNSNNAFFPYTVNSSVSSINSIVYVISPGGSGAPASTIKYLASTGTNLSFADEHDTTYVDWGSSNYISYFITGYKIRGQAIKKFQPQYIQVYSRTDGLPTSYKIQGIWNFASSGNSGKYSTLQQVDRFDPDYGTIFFRHKIRGSGYVLQFRIQSTDGMPFDIQGWAVLDTTNQGA